jgi:hypothetical protein
MMIMDTGLRRCERQNGLLAAVASASPMFCATEPQLSDATLVDEI